MTSKSRTAQKALLALEKSSAAFEIQLVEATHFIGIDPTTLFELQEYKKRKIEACEKSRYHGREDWLLKWLLKRLQDPKDEMPRTTVQTWKLLLYLFYGLPLRNIAQVLVERGFILILKRTLEEVKENANVEGTKKVTGDENTVMNSSSSDSTYTEENASTKASKKRKRDGELKGKTRKGEVNLLNLLESIHAVLSFVVESTKSANLDSAENSSFEAEYMKTVFRVSAEIAAQLLGSWMCLSQHALQMATSETDLRDWLLPFIEIWEVKVANDLTLNYFSLHCTGHLLSLLQALHNEMPKAPQWVASLEQLVARNIMIPSKSISDSVAGSELLSTFTKASIISDVSRAPLLFDVAIRSVQTSSSKRRRPQDAKWLENVFRTIKEAMPTSKVQHHDNAITQMLQLAIEHKVQLELSDLRAITSHLAFPDGNHKDWQLTATILSLDANVFVIPNAEDDLLAKLLNRITYASESDNWGAYSTEVVSTVVVPLMNEFAKARDLTGFMHHWYSQLVKFEWLRENDTKPKLVQLFSAWEDEALQEELTKLLESSLTVQQVCQVLDWLSTELEQHPNAVYVILDAIAGSISSEELADAVGLQLSRMIFDHSASDKLDERYKWRSWRIHTKSLKWLSRADADTLANICIERPETVFCVPLGNRKGFSKLPNSDKNLLDVVEVLRFDCALWSLQKSGSSSQPTIVPYLVSLLEFVCHEVTLFLHSCMLKHQDYDSDAIAFNSIQNTLNRDNAWMIWSFVHIILVEYPKIFILCLELKDSKFVDLLHDVFRMCSDTFSNRFLHTKSVLGKQEAFQSIWMNFIKSEEALNNSKLTDMLLEIMLGCMDRPAHSGYQLDFRKNDFPLRALHQSPLEIIHKKHRIFILKDWPVIRDMNHGKSRTIWYSSSIQDPAVLSMKMKIMAHHPILPEGSCFEDLYGMADMLSGANVTQKDVSLDLLKEYVRLTFGYVLKNVEQPRNSSYISEAFHCLQMKTKIESREKAVYYKHFALLSIVGVALKELSSREKTLESLGVLNTIDLKHIIATFKIGILSQLKDIFHRLRKSKSGGPADTLEQDKLLVLSIIDALTLIGVDSSELKDLKKDAKAVTICVEDSRADVNRKIQSFLTIYGSKKRRISELKLEGDVMNISGRMAIQKLSQAATEGRDNQEKLALLQAVLEEKPEGFSRLDKLLAAYFIILSIEDVHRPAKETKGVLDSDTSEEEQDKQIVDFDLSQAYSFLCSQVKKIIDVRQFFIVTKILETMLQSKGRSISQYNVDLTLCAITTICSSSSPPLPSDYAGAIYLHLCHLLQSVLIHHRLKLQGRFHTVIQTIQSLLRCLFKPLSLRITKTFASPPSWISIAQHQLTAKHAEAFTRLITLICDPSVSSVRNRQHNNLTSATDRAKREAAPHMRLVLELYIKCQLEMKMLPEIREKMIPGLYAILDTTTMESRRVIGSEMDASGRALFIGLFRDYSRFGKWKGS